MATQQATYRLITGPTGRVFRVGESPEQILGYSRWVVIIAAWASMCMAGLLEYTWGALSGSLASMHHWGPAPVFWLFSVFVIFESFVQILTGRVRDRGVPVRWLVIAGGIICGVIAYGWLASTSSLWQAYASYAALGGIGSGMVYNSCINIVAKWYPEAKGWRTGFVNGGWAYGSVPFIIGIGATATGGGAGVMSPAQTIHFIWVQGIIMTVVMVIAGALMKDPPKNWWPAHVDPSQLEMRSTRDLKANPPALHQYTLREMYNTPQPLWLGMQFALFIGSSLFGVAYYYPFANAMGLAGVAAIAGAAGFALTDGCCRPLYGYVSEFIGRRRTVTYAYALNAIFQMGTFLMGYLHSPVGFVICAIISGGLSGANFPMTAAMVADYYGENNNAVNYGSVYAWKAVGGSFAGGVAALIMTGTLYGSPHFAWFRGFLFGAILAALASFVAWKFCYAPTREQMERAVALARESQPTPERPVTA